MFNFAPLGEFVVFVLAIAIIVGCAILGLIAMIAEYLIIGLVVFIIGCEFYCLGQFIWNKLRFLFKR